MNDINLAEVAADYASFDRPVKETAAELTRTVVITYNTIDPWNPLGYSNTISLSTAEAVKVRDALNKLGI